MPARSASGRRAKRRLVLLAVAIGLVAWALGVWALAGMGGDEDEAAEARPGDRNIDAQPVERVDLVQIRDEYEWDIFDERLLVGYSDTVFAGRVLGKVGTEAAWTSIPNDDEDPHTQYAVRVLDVVKDGGVPPSHQRRRSS